jgi:ornithine--oxo-acid transaminase
MDIVDKICSDSLEERLGSNTKQVVETSDRCNATNYHPYPFAVEKAKGIWLYSVDRDRFGRRKKAMDFLAAYSSIVTHRNWRVIIPVIKEMIFGSDTVSRALYSPRLAEFSELITTMMGYDRVLPKSDGGSATDCVLKGLLSHAGERGIENPNIILTKNYFHGRPIPFAASASFDPDQQAGISIDTPWIRVVDDNLESVTQAVDENTIGIFIETHKGEGGPLFSNEEYFLGLRQLCDEFNIFFAADEIQTGLGRCGHLMAWQEYGEEARPDVVTLGKALGGGIHPVSAVLGKERFMSIYKPGQDGSTFGGNPIACAAAIASLNYIVRKNICARSMELGEYLNEQLKDIPGIEVDHRGLLFRVGLKGVKSAYPICEDMLIGNYPTNLFVKAGQYDPETDTSYIRLAPTPAALKKSHIHGAVETMKLAFEKHLDQAA